MIVCGVILYCYCQNSGSSYGKRSSIRNIEKYMEKNGPRFEQRMTAVGYSVDWEFIEKGLGYSRKVSGRRRTFYRRYPSGWVFFYATKGRNNSDRLKGGNMGQGQATNQ